MHRYLDRAKAAFLSLPFLAQWAIITLVKSIVASSLMSFLAMYATAVFAMRHGFRVPVEGVPFLHFAIALATFATFAATIILFGIMMMLFNYIKRYTTQFFNNLELATSLIPKKGGKTIAKRIRFYLKLSMASNAMLVLAAVFFLFSISILLETRIATEIWSKLPGVHFNRPLDVVLASSIISVTIIAVWCVENDMSWIAAQIFASVLIFTVMAFGLFANDVYGSLLRIIRYGGGMAAIVNYVQGDNKALATIKGNLLILTTTNAVMVDSEKKDIVEIFLKNIITIEYETHPNWELPSYGLVRQKDLLDLDVSKERKE